MFTTGHNMRMYNITVGLVATTGLNMRIYFCFQHGAHNSLAYNAWVAQLCQATAVHLVALQCPMLSCSRTFHPIPAARILCPWHAATHTPPDWANQLYLV